MNTDDLYRILRAGHVQAQGIVDTVADPLLVLGTDLCVLAASRSFYRTFHVDSEETLGRPVYELGNRQWDIPELRRLLEEVVPKTAAVINYEVRHEFPQIGARTMLLTARTLHHPDGGSRSLLLSIVDATDRLRHEREKDLLFGELRHRMKNFLSVAQAMARQTTTKGRSAEEYRDIFLGRFAALIRAEGLAFDEAGETGLKEVLERQLAVYACDSARVVIEPGDGVDLLPRQVRSLSLALHELATNAVKYGALSSPEGELRLAWRLEDAGGKVRLIWAESGGPAVVPPAASGFGTTVVRTAIEYNLHGRLEQDFAPEGFRAEIVIPLGSAAPDG